jgi:hypothetical protein
MGKNPTQYEVMNCCLISCALETGFLGAWCCCDESDVEDALKAYQLSWSYAFDRRLIMDYASMPPQNDDTHKCFKFKFSLKPDAEILVNSWEAGDMIIVTAHLVDSSIMKSTYSLALVMSRYVIHKKLNSANPAASFRNLNELSIKLKNEIFLPLRNNIFCESSCKTPYPSLHGVPENILLMIFRYTPKDVAALSLTCKDIRQIAVPYLLRNKSKKD